MINMAKVCYAMYSIMVNFTDFFQPKDGAVCEKLRVFVR